MAYNFSDFPNTEPSSTLDPYGNFIDDPAGVTGTPLNKLTLADVFLTLQRMAAQSGITLNDLPDNHTNGWQLSKAIGGEAWDSGPTLVFQAFSGGSISGGTVVYNKYRIVGKTIYWQVYLFGATISGSPSIIYVNAPWIGSLPNTDFQKIGLYNSNPTLLVTFNSPHSTGEVSFTVVGGGTFTNGSANQNIAFEIMAELP